MGGQVLQWVRISSRLSIRLAHSSYICEGASTKPRSTLVPECWLYSVFDSTPCNTCPNSCSRVSSSLWVRPLRSKFVTSTLIGFRPAHWPGRGVLVLTRARVEVEVDAADHLARAGVADVEVDDVVVPHRNGELVEAEAVEPLADVEHPAEGGGRGEVRPQRFLVDGVTPLAQALAVEHHFPALDPGRLHGRARDLRLDFG